MMESIDIKKADDGSFIIHCRKKEKGGKDGEIMPYRGETYTAVDLDGVVDIVKKGFGDKKNEDKKEGETKPKDDTADWMKKRKKEVKEK